MLKRHIALFLCALAALATVACDDAPESGRAVITVRDVNDGSPIESDVDDGGLVYEDLVTFEFISRPYNEYITGPRGDAILESYTVSWVRVDGGSGTLESHTENTSLYVGADNFASLAVRLVTWEDKTGPILSPIVGTTNLVTMRADVDFKFREVGTEHEIKAKASVTVHFADTQ